jgi:hypothetical protein
MSGTNEQPGSRPRHALHRAIWATAAAATILVLAACAATSAAVPGSTPKPSALSFARAWCQGALGLYVFKGWCPEPLGTL